ncbi:T9SS type A sorting domain-containing protein [Hymenobacter aerilatus]|uniref:T9SS type A sorting domain-containing protein n=1 Tax=Hymenobacter aerilatus TaxID=2932251 RepID=A0A8T9SYT9_9BACT|nr:T9SS type A sorting domain-containing protein [Hymenobacter aerilatus]UOR04976.1 T9SS type A sorting domain-containing protein [Hymenobacter aerilatus]
MATLLSLTGWHAQAQYTFTDTNLAPYRQNFNTLSGSLTVTSEGSGLASRLNAAPEVYAQANFGTDVAPSPFAPAGVGPNDGTNGAANYYHFGIEGVTVSTDRSFGGVASFGFNGVGYVGIRLKNSSTKTITNLEIQYAMEQWYNSGRQDQAKVAVSYKTGTGLRSLLGATGAGATDWKSLNALDVEAPSTATVLQERDGNAASNRRVRQTTLTGLNLAVGQEIMIRWAYALNDATNGNGLSIDDVVITPQTNIYYSTTTGELNQFSSWNTSANGTGTRPTSFATPNTVYYVRGNSTSSRIRGNKNYPEADTWTVSGVNSKVIVGDPTGAATNLFLDDNDDINATIDLLANATLQVKRPTYSLTLGTLAHTSTVEYMATNAATRVLPGQYGQLKLSNATEKTLVGNILITNALLLGSKLMLGDYTLTLQRDATVSGVSGSNYVVTNGKGTLRQSVVNNDTDVLYPVGASASSYTPIWLKQPTSTTARNEDVFGVRVLDDMYSSYDASGTGTKPVTNQNVKRTWLVDEEVAGNSDVTMTLQWNGADEATGTYGFVRAKSYISHYTGGVFDQAAPASAATGSVAGSYKLSRAGITSFSPFVVSSNPGTVLPVELVAFSAQRTGAAVTAAWATASEKNNDYFTVERSLDGVQFVAVGKIAGAGSSTTRHQYTFVDQEAPATLAYYRLRQTDLDGTTAYSTVVTVGALRSAAGNWAVVPNPGNGLFQLRTPVDVTLLSGEVYNSVGTRVAALPTTGLSSFDLTQQPSGMYVLRLQTSQGPTTVRVVKN